MTSIIIRNNNRILIKESGIEVNINDGDIIQYTGIYYKEINDIVRRVNIETTFVGVIETCRYRYDTDTTGIYVKPLYIWDIMNEKWYKIVNLNPPQTKYFLYPHLLSLSLQNDYHCSSLYFLDSCENKSLEEFANIDTLFELFNFS